MNAQDVISQIKALPKEERDRVVKFVIEGDDSWIPDEFKQGMEDAESGLFADMETVMSDAPPPPRAGK